MFWFDNKREFDGVLCDGRIFTVSPDVICDVTALPFDSATFNLVVFDPPHLIRVSDTAYMCAKYGRLPQDWQSFIRAGFAECMRVLVNYGVLIFKWSEVQIPLSEIIEAIGSKPLFGNRQPKQSKTHWLCFMKGVEE